MDIFWLIALYWPYFFIASVEDVCSVCILCCSYLVLNSLAEAVYALYAWEIWHVPVGITAFSSKKLFYLHLEA